MGRKNRDSTKTDLSSFMCVILMLTGAMITVMVSNVVIMSANPENMQITSIIPTGFGTTDREEPVTDMQGNRIKSPYYLEVYRDRMIIYPGNVLVNITDLESRTNQFEQLLKTVEARRETEYIVLLVRPYGSTVARKLKKTILSRGIDIGVDLLDQNMPVNLRVTGGRGK